MPTTTEWTRVVVLTPPQAGMSDRLKSVFAARDWFAIEQHDPHLAMAELCLRERAQAARATWGLHRMEQIALVVLQPESWDDLQALTDAVQRYVPSASIWTSDGAELTALAESSSTSSEAPAPTLAVSRAADEGAVPASLPFFHPQEHRAYDNGGSIDRLAHLARSTNRAPNLRMAACEQPISSKSADVAEQANGAEAESNSMRARSRISREEIDMLLALDPSAGEGDQAGGMS